ncbi:MAG: DNA mismatch repair endonuclease MutL [Clostridiaceae bacterium]|nr:DNA mismatch repair endonuclease MutL [Clostridiaceae bacterium]
MSRIKVLDAITANSIAAGEVVERPASVVKELCENALDAGADVITVVIKNGGIRLIQVSDNGSGMDYDDAVNAFKAHATSKLHVITDLEALTTMGFRGEALASISAVAKVTLKTRTENDDDGTLVKIEGGELVRHESCGTPVGTTVMVENLFYNTPARYKFLKKDTTEAGRVADIIQRLILARPDVSFRLINNDQQVLHSPGNNDLASAIYSVYNKKSVGELLPIKTTHVSSIQVSGFIGLPEFARKSRQMELFFVNDRMVQSPMLKTAVEEGYRSYLVKGRFPIAILKLTVASNLIDVNVHPQKTEIRFWNDGEVFRTVRNAVSETLGGSVGPTAVGSSAIVGDNVENKTNQGQETKSYPVKARTDHFGQEQFASDFQGEDRLLQQSKLPVQQKLGKLEHSGALKLEDAEQSYSVVESKIGVPAGIEDSSASQVGESSEDSVKVDATDRSNEQGLADSAELDHENAMTPILEGRLAGHLFNTYIIIEGRDCFYLIDQHAAHEKINFERIVSTYRSKQVITQPLLSPEVVDLSPSEIALAESERDFIENLGFEFEQFGQNAVVIRSFPVVTATLSPGLAFSALLEQLDQLPAEIIAEREKKITYIIYWLIWLVKLR